MDRERDVAREYAVLSTHATYQEAQEVVDRLSDEGFPVETTRIVGSDVVWIEDVTGRRRYLQAAGSGAATGAWIGLFVGFIIGLFDFFEPLVSAISLAFWGLVFGLVAGAVAGLIGHALTGGRRDFSSVGRFAATSYRVEVMPSAAERARGILDRAA